ncbi:MAG TPA: NAD(P)-dependent oxidoreductase, partial [Planctomycetota bacterium]|nr:NAD(P)-dependent oxidoreductase [Planctomycetota bacterium]
GHLGHLLQDALGAHEVWAPSRTECDLRDASGVERARRAWAPEAVILAAGIASADRCEDAPGEAYATNVDGARNAARASRGLPLVHFSTDHVFDGRTGPYCEEDRPNPLSVYGRTKLESERIVQSVNPRSLILRTSLVWSARGRSFFATVREARGPLPCWTDQSGTYTYGPNLARATVELLETGQEGVWHLAGTDVLNRHAFALRVAKRYGLDPALFVPVSIHDAPPRAPRPLRAGLRVGKAQSQLRTRLWSTDEALEAVPGA